MWESALPAATEMLRQGDLLTGVPFPKRGSVRLTPEGIIAEMHPAEPVLVLDQCCTIDKKYTVLLARVRQGVRPRPGKPMYDALLNTTFEEGRPFAKYAHLLEEPPTLKPTGPLWAADLLERFSYAAKEPEELQWLQERRVGRMTASARALVRLKLQYHFGEIAEEDVEELAGLGLNKFGLPISPEQPPSTVPVDDETPPPAEKADGGI